MIALEPYQASAVEWLQSHPQGIVQIPAGGGKTIVAAAALHRIITDHERTEPVRVGWLAPTIETRDQAARALQTFPELQGHDLKVQCASTVADMRDRQILIVDECKHAIAPMWRKIIEPCSRRWGFDATPFGDDSDENKQLRELFGNEMFSVARGQVGSRLVNGRVYLVDASDDCGPAINAQIQALTDRMKNQASFTCLTDLDIKIRATGLAVNEIGIVNNQRRNAAVVSLAHQHATDAVLILVNSIEHGEALAAAIGNGARAVSAKIGKKARREAMDAVKAGECKCLIATSLADEGLDLPILNVLILASGGKSKIKAEQRTGRVLRAFGDKEHGTIYDFLDSKHPTMAAHSAKRVSLYRSLGYEVQRLET